MLLAMARDVRVILVKLADRTHNMRTLDFVPPEKRRRIALETMEIYAPIAHRLGLNTIYRELQELSFKVGSPFRYATLEKAVKAARGNRREVVKRILEAAQSALAGAGIVAELSGARRRCTASTARCTTSSCRSRRCSTSMVSAWSWKRRCTATWRWARCTAFTSRCRASSRTTSPFRRSTATSRCTRRWWARSARRWSSRSAPGMHQIAEAGVAAHWMYKHQADHANDIQQQAHQWLQSLLDIQSQTGDSQEFLEHVKIDLFPDAVYVFTPRGTFARCRAARRRSTLPTRSTATWATSVAVKINNELPLRTELKSGDIVEVVTAPYSKPNPAWLAFVRTGKARAAIRHYLKTTKLDEAIQLGERLLEQSTRQLGIELKAVPQSVWDRMIQWTGNKLKEDIFADLALGRRVPAVVARRMEILLQELSGDVDSALLAAVQTFAGKMRRPCRLPATKACR
jgi:GTP pyrophosphokinase